ALMEQIGAGRAVPPVVDCYRAPRGPRTLHLRRDRITRLFGARVPEADVVRILQGLGLEVRTAADGWDVVAPTYRVDLTREADLIEEVGRHYGFDKLEATFPRVTQPALRLRKPGGAFPRRDAAGRRARRARGPRSAGAPHHDRRGLLRSGQLR